MNTLLAVLLLSLPWHIPLPQSCSILFAGDMMQHRSQIESASRGQGFSYDDCFEAVKGIVSAADIAVCNLEVTLGGAPYTGYPAFSAPDEFAKAITDAGFDIMLTANNHCLDRGRKGLVRTLDVLDSLGIKHLGTYRNQAERDSLYPLIVESDGIRLALLDYTYGVNAERIPSECVVNFIDTLQMAKDINKARAMNAACVIVCLHWGDEYHIVPNNFQKKLAAWLVRNGADHIVGSHPHVIQPTEIVPGPDGGSPRHLVAYSLGNLISGMSAPNTDTGTLLEMRLRRYLSVTWLDGYSEYKVRTLRPARGKQSCFRLVID